MRWLWKQIVGRLMSTACSWSHSMKPVTWDTWLWWRCWCPGEPCWTRLAMRTILPFTMLFGMDTSPSPICSCSSGPRRTYCKSYLDGYCTCNASCDPVCLFFFTCSDFHSVLVSCLVHSPPHKRVRNFRNIKKKNFENLYVSIYGCGTVLPYQDSVWTGVRPGLSLLPQTCGKCWERRQKGTREVPRYSLLN